MGISEIIVTAGIFVLGFFVGSDINSWSKKSREKEYHIQWQQGYNAGWSDALSTKQRLTDKENLNR